MMLYPNTAPPTTAHKGLGPRIQQQKGRGVCFSDEVEVVEIEGYDDDTWLQVSTTLAS
jgi:hypothetical protein